MSEETTKSLCFSDLGLPAPIMKVLDEIGYELPSPIQAKMIPHVLNGSDVLGQAQTGTGKTAAFALPLLARMDMKQKTPQVLVLAPTRELAIQVAEAFAKYATHMKGLHVLPVYGGADYGGQIRALKRGVHVVVGTPGRVMDHMRKGTLKLGELKCMVLDEADEMLRMGFIDDVEWILEQTPDERQVALFSATMPRDIQRIAERHLKDAVHVKIQVKTTTADTINQRYWMVSGVHKLDALTRMLEAETIDGMLVFVRTKAATAQLAEKLEARGFSTAALNGDIAQSQRERTVNRFKSGHIDIMIATDVAARGLDVDRISHVVNYDIPLDTESYVHRIGRTGRAGRKGEAILFVSPRERRLLRAIEKATNKKIDEMQLPTTEIVNNKRVANFMQKITDTLGSEELNFYQEIIEKYRMEHNIPAIEVAAALAKLAQGDTPLLVEDAPVRSKRDRFDDFDNDRKSHRGKGKDGFKKKGDFKGKGEFKSKHGQGAIRGKEDRAPRGDGENPGPGMERFRIEVGETHGVKAANIVGAITNEAGLRGSHIGKINIQGNYSTVDLPEGMPKEIFTDLKKVYVAGQQMNISKAGGGFKGKGKSKPKGKRRD